VSQYGSRVSHLSEHLRELAAPVWAAERQHPFVRGLGDGTLSDERFARWLRQDYLFLQGFARLYAYGVTRARDLDGMELFARLVHETLHVEMGLHRSYCAEHGIHGDELAAEEPLPTTRAYVDLLVATAAGGDLEDIACVLLPCTWGYHELGLALDRTATAEGRRRFGAWIAMYAGEEMAEATREVRDLVDRLGDEVGPERRRALETLFLTASRYELRFWEMCWAGEAWPPSLTST